MAEKNGFDWLKFAFWSAVPAAIAGIFMSFYDPEGVMDFVGIGKMLNPPAKESKKIKIRGEDVRPYIVPEIVPMPREQLPQDLPEPAEPESKPKKLPEGVYLADKKREHRTEVAQIAMRLYEECGHMSYVWGGETEKPPAEARNDPFYAGIDIPKKQPPGSWRSGKPTEPGFDCSGFVWRVYKEAGVRPFVDARLTADDYFGVKAGDVVLKPGRHTWKEVVDTAEEGDVFYLFNEQGRATHMGIYLGGGLLVESAGVKEGLKDPKMGGIQTAYISKYRGRNIAVKRYLMPPALS